MHTKRQFTIALAGNPNVGKSTIFNNLTGLNQHTGNWTGKTVDCAKGRCKYGDDEFILTDLPGTYSLTTGGSDEEAARNFLCFNSPDAVIFVADSTILERNLNLLLQILEITNNVVLCLNLIDEAKKKKISIDTNQLSNTLGIPVVCCAATKKQGLFPLLDAAKQVILNGKTDKNVLKVDYGQAIETAIEIVANEIEKVFIAQNNSINIKTQFVSYLNNSNDIGILEKDLKYIDNCHNSKHFKLCRFIAIKVLEGERSFVDEVKNNLDIYISENENVFFSVIAANEFLTECGIQSECSFSEEIIRRIFCICENISTQAIRHENPNYNNKNLKIDRILTSRAFGIPIMLAFLAAIFFITIQLANYPSSWLAQLFSLIEDTLNKFSAFLKVPNYIRAPIVDGIFRTTAWVISVMLPPMAIFFPLFTLLEDFGYLPRIAFNLDKPFKRCGCCGKQSLTMCMGFGCNAAGVIGTRIIDSPRERIVAIVTNSLVPCNGRFPTLITLSNVMVSSTAVSGFFVGGIIANSLLSGIISTLIVTFAVILGILATFLVSLLLNKTLLKGARPSYVLELPPFRIPQIKKVLLRSLIDRTLKVLARAVVVAAPCGLAIWLLSNLSLAGHPLLYYIATFLNPFARLMGLDGYILTAFLLGFPANEIVLPIAVMSYTASGTLSEIGGISSLSSTLKANGWTTLTLINTMIFCLFHFPCATTCLTIKKESRSAKWTAISIIIPTLIGVFLCMIVTLVAKFFALF